MGRVPPMHRALRVGAARWRVRRRLGDCDGDAANGSEVNTSETSAAHCGGCGRQCPAAPRATVACVMAAAATCEAGLATATARRPTAARRASRRPSPTAAAGWARARPPAHATATCAAGACGFTCDAGFADCDIFEPANGCETDTRTAVAHCGACGARCPAVAGAAPTCAVGRCGSACDPGAGQLRRQRANGRGRPLRHRVLRRLRQRLRRTPFVARPAGGTARCVSGFARRAGALRWRVRHHARPRPGGGCGAACPVAANARAPRRLALLGFLQRAGFGDCDGDATNGCEADSTPAPPTAAAGATSPDGPVDVPAPTAAGAARSPARPDPRRLQRRQRRTAARLTSVATRGALRRRARCGDG